MRTDSRYDDLELHAVSCRRCYHPLFAEGFGHQMFRGCCVICGHPVLRVELSSPDMVGKAVEDVVWQGPGNFEDIRLRAIDQYLAVLKGAEAPETTEAIVVPMASIECVVCLNTLWNANDGGPAPRRCEYCDIDTGFRVSYYVGTETMRAYGIKSLGDIVLRANPGEIDDRRRDEEGAQRAFD